MTPTIRAINQLITDLDSGRADGTIYTYGQVQERLRAIVAAEAEAPTTNYTIARRDQMFDPTTVLPGVSVVFI